MTKNPPSLRGFAGADMPDLAEAARCVRCGLCLPHCPTYLETLRETSSPRGRIRLIGAVGAGALDVLSPGFVAQMHQCLDCRACEAACPSGIDYGHLLESARAQIAQASAKSMHHRRDAALLHGLFGDLRRFHATVALMRASQVTGGMRLARLLGLLRRLHDAVDLLPPLPNRFFFPRGQRYDPLPQKTPQATARPSVATKAASPMAAPMVALLAGCVMGTLGAETDRATVRVLRAAGHAVMVPAGQQCCGALATHAGMPDQARDLARRNIAAFDGSDAALVVTNAAGCGAALKDYGHLLADDPVWAERAQAFSARVRDITEVLADNLAALIPHLHPVPLRVTYQEPCHLAHAQRITRAPRELLAAIPGLEVVEMAESALCCGSAGIYNLTQPAMAKRLQTRKVTNIRAALPALAVTANPGCFLQVRAGLRKSESSIGILHIVDLLDASLGGLGADAILALARR